MNRAIGVALAVMLALPAVARAATADSVAKVEPACPNIGTDAKTGRFLTETITVSYDPHAKTAALHGPTTLTMHLAPVGFPGAGPSQVKDFAMSRKTDGAWSASFTLSGGDAGAGVALLDFEDQAQRIDKNRGQYWDLTLCRFGAPLNVSAKAITYEGREIAPGFQRAPDLPRALSILRENFAKNADPSELFNIWHYELEIGNHSPATYQQISLELSEQLDKWNNNPSMLMQVNGFVGPAQDELDPAVVAKYRASILATPSAQPMQYWQTDGKLHPVARTQQWDAGIAREMQMMFGELDFWPVSRISDPSARAVAFEDYARKYADCQYCSRVASAYIGAFESYEDQHDLDSVARVEREWGTWDPNNPDPLASLAGAYLKANVNLEDAQRLTDEAANLYAPFADQSTFQSLIGNVRSKVYKTAVPFPGEEARILALRGKIEAARGDWAGAAKDLQLACDEKTEDNSAEAALGTALEHTGDEEGGLAAYLKAASAPYQTSPEPEENFRRLFVAMHKGTEAQAEASLAAAVQANQKVIADKYVPVELHREMPALELKTLSGVTLQHPLPKHEAAVVDFWSVWCGACVVELPSLLAFQQSHPHVSVLAVAITDKPSEVQEFLRKKHLDQLHVAVIAQMPSAFPEGLPTTAVMSPAGQLAFVHEGAPADLTAVLQKDLAQLQR